MFTPRWLSVLLLALALVAGATWLLQRQAAAQLRDEIALLRDENRQLANLRAENAKLVAAQPPAAEVDRLRADRAAVVQLRGEIEKLKAGVEVRESALKISAPKKAAPEDPPAAVPQVLSVSSWKNAGQATPMAALETLLWAGSTGNVDVLAAALAFDPKATKRAQEMFDGASAAEHQEYGSPFRMVAALMAKEMPLGEARITEEKSLDPNPAFTSVNATLNADLKDKDGGMSAAHFEFVKINEGWLLKVPGKVVEHFGAEQRESAAAK